MTDEGRRSLGASAAVADLGITTTRGPKPVRPPANLRHCGCSRAFARRLACTWLEVKGLALPEFQIEIELEARIR